ncbi:MAG: SUF system NifU family Fe-S cluster assembly protein [Thermoflexaceae bacterium]|nr:SUF system NifU family Fe-S cluster assembly protein [Thermoflexaceae bacterium]
MAIAEPQFDDLYREVIIDHFRKPRNRGTLPAPTQHAEGMNPVCGDEIMLDLDVASGTITALAFTGQGCSISQSSASMMTERVAGRTISEAEQIADAVSAMLVDGADPAAEIGHLEALQGVAKFPVRVKCALLAWKVLREGLDQAKSPAAV